MLADMKAAFAMRLILFSVRVILRGEIQFMLSYHSNIAATMALH